MKKNILFSFGFLLLFSCRPNQSVKEKVATNSVDTTIAENNLNKQLTEYITATGNGDLERVLHYAYPDQVEYFQSHNQDFKANMQQVTTAMKKNKRILEERNIICEYVVGDIARKTNFESSKLCLVNTFVYAKRKPQNQILRTLEQKFIAISNDNGANWMFVENNSDAIREILMMNFPQNIINQLLAKD